VHVVERAVGSADPIRVAAAKTDADGHFLYRIKPGPSRAVDFSYPVVNEGVAAASAQVSVRVRAGVRLSASAKAVRNGKALRFSGRVLGSRSRRALVTIYALSSGPRKRIPVETVRARADGRFHYTYRFTSIPGPVVYRFEARVPKQTGFPYEAGVSKVVKVRGRP
jgi:hypothetical protein